MLVMTHKAGDKIYIGDDIVVEIVEVHGGRVRLGYAAPKTIPILREKVKERNNPVNEAGEPSEIYNHRL